MPYVEENHECVRILGRSFLATTKATIDVEFGEVVIGLNIKQVNFSISKHERDDHGKTHCYLVKMI